MTAPDPAIRIDRAQRLEILEAAGYKCQLEYPGICSITATEIADVGTLKAACKNCRRQRDSRKHMARRLAGRNIKRV